MPVIIKIDAKHSNIPMLREKTVLLIVVLIGSLSGLAQMQPSYSFQKDDTVLRKKYLDQSVQKKKLLLASVGKEQAKAYTTIYEQQFEEIENLWQGSRSVTAPPAHAYLQAIVQKIITANPALKETDARVVFSRDWWPNAVSMGDGSIAINAGLVIHLNNEAELAFIICHELSHYYLEHTPRSIKKYVANITSDSYQAELKRLSRTEYGANQQLEALAKTTVFNSRRHSRDNEAEADRQAFIFMKKTGYDCQAIKTCLELMNHVDDSLLYKRPDIQQAFNFAVYPFKKKWVQQESAIFSQLDESSTVSTKEKDSLKTHPDCTNRIALLADSLKKITIGGKPFLVDENLFNQLKKDFFIEITEQCYKEKNLSRNLYYSLSLLQASKNSSWAKYAIARCLNDIFYYQQEHKIGLMLDAENKAYPIDYNLLLRMLGRLRLSEIAGINYNFCKQHYAEMKAYPGFDEEVQKVKSRKTE